MSSVPAFASEVQLRIHCTYPSRRPSLAAAVHALNLARRRPRRPRVINAAPIFNLFSHHVRHTMCTYIAKGFTQAWVKYRIRSQHPATTSWPVDQQPDSGQ
ncbi:hypothetical protein F441_07129 [Phytophthora nicotianae CJ01A1]|uniref:Uncharacterized protein n=5 Tax=Phytophthora nicotianae TaxID=4792 RepID=V9EFV5_PHYNI|nr:hypothetical protein F443_16072 [Phytophthora nicotianae P1569]ETK88789.1 hypothetical protein L915_07003 [Phytophthora nicotianae]ETO66887.1 hypothetical protein F444_16055 [Phytophthora nicotianae P1976]ETP18675.1 hypothetical protein F441_07129 [Phytophthora nicotianae CJ01A1]ETP46598.1 hypothetical protein F442_07175 [Phytophthora nicotianae P10297]